MNFYEWMIGKYYGKDTPRGDLAGDMKHEEAGFPKDGDRQRILDYLDGMFACDEWKIAFVELKAPGKKPRPLQEKRMRQLKSLGFPVYVVDGIEQIGGVLDEICAT